MHSGARATLNRIVAVGGAAAILVTSAACGTDHPMAPGQAASVRPTAITAPGTTARARAVATPQAPSASGTGCPSARRAWAVDVTPAGRTAWQVGLAADPSQPGIVLQPVVLGGDAVFAETDAVYALRPGDGAVLWQRSFGPVANLMDNAVYGIWPWHGDLVVLVGQVGPNARLVSLDAVSGAVRWTTPLGKQGLLGSQALTSDGVLGMLTPRGVLEAADLSTGTILWHRTVGTSLGPVAVGTTIAAASSGHAAGFDGRTGRPLWMVAGLSPEPELSAAGGLVLVTSAAQGPGLPTALTALDPRTGKVAWRFGPSAAIVADGPAGIVLATYSPDKLYLVDPATGRVRWSAATFAVAGAVYPIPSGALAETATDVVLFEGRGAGALVDRSAATGAVRWSAPPPAGNGYLAHVALIPLPSGPAVAVVGSASTGNDYAATLEFRDLATGRRLATATLPTVVQAPLAVAGGRVLAQLDDPGCAMPA